MTSTKNMLEARGLCKQFGPTVALEDFQPHGPLRRRVERGAFIRVAGAHALEVEGTQEGRKIEVLCSGRIFS